MRLACPYCGERSLDEFSYSGDATVTRPDFAGPDPMSDFVAYTFVRTNPPGPHRELWYHAAGCHAWLVVTRNVSTHEILGVEAARDVALDRNPAA
jgi:heterotetrameric sarcosine oxidase delta subunit